METKVEVTKSSEAVHVLLIGNNPIDMSKILDTLNQIRGAKVITEIAFDLKSILERLLKFKPNYILIDDNIGKSELSQTVNALAQRSQTKNIPITVLKNSNYQESCGATSILDYMLKTNLSADSLYKTIKNSLKFRKTQLNLYKAYHRRRTALKNVYMTSQI